MSIQYIKATEVTGTAHTFAAANCEADWLMMQDDCYGARVYYSTTDKLWHVQSIHAAGDEWRVGAWLPDGMRFVLCPTGLLNKLLPAHPQRQML